MEIYVFPRQPEVPGLELWPVHQASPERLAPDAGKTVAAEFGQLGAGVDHGTVRKLDDGRLEVARPGGVWVPLDLNGRGIRLAILTQARYGPGWSFVRVAQHGGEREIYGQLSALDPVKFPPRVRITEKPTALGPLDDVDYDEKLRDATLTAWAKLQEPPATGTNEPPPEVAQIRALDAYLQRQWANQLVGGEPTAVAAERLLEQLRTAPTTDTKPAALSADGQRRLRDLAVWTSAGKPIGPNNPRRLGDVNALVAELRTIFGLG